MIRLWEIWSVVLGAKIPEDRMLCSMSFFPTQLKVFNWLVSCKVLMHRLLKFTFNNQFCCLKSIHFWNSVFWLYENKVLQLMSAGASLKRFGEKYLVFKKCKSCKHCFKNEWTLLNLVNSPLINYLRTEAEAVWTTQLVGSRLLSRLEEDPGAGDIVAGVHVCSRCNRAASCNQKVSLVKVDSDLKVRLGNCEDLGRSCESLNFHFPAQGPSRTILLTEKPHC